MISIRGEPLSISNVVRFVPGMKKDIADGMLSYTSCSTASDVTGDPLGSVLGGLKSSTLG
jgi:hypothetical protein